MKLDKELVREIMLAVEASDTLPIQWVTLDLPGRTLEETSYHVMLLDEAGFIEGQKLTMCGRPSVGKLEQSRCNAGWCGHVSDLFARHIAPLAVMPFARLGSRSLTRA